ncbi:tetratricopeptide repeat protein [Chloroflexus sp.]|uniref:tetratricopeptide repeat protein n=1 Tax=Chloroflexus sp. TaxID=1904827 RepID=UPI002ADDEC7D|nr:tetratricopeptide repeat protein [Chloroflexus sp.]
MQQVPVRTLPGNLCGATGDRYPTIGYTVAREEGDYPTARRYYEEALAIFEAVLGRRHRATAVTLHALGNVAQAEGDYPTARRYYEEALDIKEAVLGRRHRETFVTRFARSWLVWKVIWEAVACAVLPGLCCPIKSL